MRLHKQRRCPEDDESWLGDDAAGLRLELDPLGFALRLGDRLLACGVDPMDLDRRRLARLVEGFTRVSVVSQDGVGFQRLIRSVDALEGLGFRQVAVDVQATTSGARTCREPSDD